MFDLCSTPSAPLCHPISYVRSQRDKPFENYLLVPSAIDRAAARRVLDQARRSGKNASYCESAVKILNAFAEEQKPYVLSQYIDCRIRFERGRQSGRHQSEITQSVLRDLETKWANEDIRLNIIPGKEAIGEINQHLQATHGVNITPTAIIDAMSVNEIPSEMQHIIAGIAEWSGKPA